MKSVILILLNLFLRFARSRIGGRLAGWLVAHMSFLIPLHRLCEKPHLLAFYHPQPAYRVHILLVPRRELAGFTELEGSDAGFLQELVTTVQELVRELDLEKSGYRLIVNGGAYQEVKQLHFHLVSGPQVEAVE